MASVLTGLGAVALAAGVCGPLCCMDWDERSLPGRVVTALWAVPPAAYRVLQALRLAWVADAVGRCGHWFMYKRHPVIQILYCLLMFGGYLTFVWFGYPLLGAPFNRYMGAWHRWTGGANFVLCLVTFCMASFSNPGVITPANVTEYMRLFRYDGFHYSLKDCPTCEVPKVARSKHCRTCDVCVSKFDHHCVRAGAGSGAGGGGVRAGWVGSASASLPSSARPALSHARPHPAPPPSFPRSGSTRAWGSATTAGSWRTCSPTPCCWCTAPPRASPSSRPRWPTTG